MKIQIPEQLKAEVPQSKWGKILSATPVVMAVVATLLAGMASSEMTRAQYVRSLAAQQQSKAGDQWSFFQAKRLRGALQRNTVDLMQSMSIVRPLAPGAMKSALSGLSGLTPESVKAQADLLTVVESAAGQQALGYLQSGDIPQLPAAPAVPSAIRAALEGMEASVPDAEMEARLAVISEKDLEQAAREARDQAQAFDVVTTPVNRTVEQINDSLTRLLTGLPEQPGLGALHRAFAAARLRYTATRYETEARLNQAIANYYELQVRKSNLLAQRHHLRSQRFFFGMLGAQLGVIVSTLAMAVRRKNLLWAVAAVAGLLAVAFAIYVYLCV